MVVSTSGSNGFTSSCAAIGLTSIKRVNKNGNTIPSSYDKTANQPIIPENILKTLKTDYLDSFIDNSDDITFGTFHRLLTIINELKYILNKETRSDYEILIVEVMRLFTSLLHKAQSQFIEIQLLTKNLDNANNLINIKNEEIKNLKIEIDTLKGVVNNNNQLSGFIHMTGRELPHELLILARVDIVTAWYYLLHGKPKQNEILEPDKVTGIFSYLANNFSNLQEAQNELARQLGY